MHGRFALIALLFFPGLTFHAQRPKPNQTRSEKLAAFLVGNYVGTATYRPREPSGSKAGAPPTTPLITRATWVTIQPGDRRGSIRWTTVWDDVAEVSSTEVDITFDFEHGRVQYKYKDSDDEVVFDHIEGLELFLENGIGKIVLSRVDRKADDRLTITLTRSLLVREREGRDQGGTDYQLAQRMLLTRDRPPGKK